MEQEYWLRRKREEFALAWNSTSAAAKLIHFDLAGRYSIKALQACLPEPAEAKI